MGSDSSIRSLGVIHEAIAVPASGGTIAPAHLALSDAWFRQLADATPGMNWAVGADRADTHYNRRWLEFTGRTLDEEIRDGWPNGVHPEDRDRAIREWHEAFAARRPIRAQYRLRRHDGVYRWLLDTGEPFFNSQGEFLGFAGTCIDITDMVSTRQALEVSLAQYEQLVNTLDCVVWEACPTSFRFRFVSPQAERITGYPVSEWLEPNFWMDHVHPDDREAAAAFCKDSTASFRDHQFEYRFRTADGRHIWLRDFVTVVMDGREIRALRGILVDVTEQKRAEEELRRREREFRSLAENLPDVIERVDACHRHLFASRNIERYCGIPAERFLGKTLADLNLPARLVELKCREIEAAHRSGRPRTFEYWHDAPEGSTCFEIRVVPEPGPPGSEPTALIISRDVTAQRRLLDALRNSEERFRQICETINEVFYMVELNPPRVVALSPSFESATGVSCADVLADSSAWLKAVHPEDRPRVIEAWRACQSTGHFNMEYRVLRPDGDIRWFHDRAFPVVFDGGGLKRYAGVAEDVTEKKHAEQARRYYEQQAATMRKMDALGSLAGTVAHEFNNFLSVIQGNAGRLLGTMEDGPGTAWMKEGVEQILAAAGRASRLTRQLSRMARRQPDSIAVVDAHQVVRDVMSLLRHALGDDIEILLGESSETLLVRVDRARLEQAIINLVLNARDAMPHGGELRLDVSADEFLTTADQVVRSPCAGPMVLIAVRDTGIGVDPANRDRLFEPFFTTKGEAGTGLGLSFVADFARDHGGCVRAVSTPGGGSCFRICLPRVFDGRDANAVST